MSMDSASSPLRDAAAPALSKQENLLHALTLIRLRWFAIGAQTLTGVLASQLLQLPVRIGDFLLVILAEILFNLIAHLRVRANDEPTERWLMGSIAFDLFALTNLLFVSGGAFNPFTTLYVIQVAIASVMLPTRKTAVIVALSSLGFAALYLSPSTVLGIPQADGLGYQVFVLDRYHLAGMWVAHLVASISVAFFTGRLSAQRRIHQHKAGQAALHAERSRRLASLAALATGAAHEIATPLSTIAVAASELEDIAGSLDHHEDILEDAQLIRREVARCRSILDRMAVESGYVRGQSVTVRRLDEFLEDTFTRVHHASRVEVHQEVEASMAHPLLNGALAHALAAVLNNATLATPRQVQLRIQQTSQLLIFEVEDDGVGMSPEVIAHATEPFFTTRDAGRGMGLGLFLAYNVTKTLHANLQIDSELGVGTTVRFELPLQLPPSLATHGDMPR